MFAFKGKPWLPEASCGALKGLATLLPCTTIEHGFHGKAYAPGDHLAWRSNPLNP